MKRWQKLWKSWATRWIAKLEVIIRLTTQENGEHHITIPNHSPIKIGTLSAILRDIENHFDVTREELLIQLFS